MQFPIQISDLVWYGAKPTLVENPGQFQSVVNVAHSLRRPYWDDLGKLPWDVRYFRMASPDAEPLRASYMMAFEKMLDAIRLEQKWPTLFHCRVGGHRGPSSAIFAHWYWSGKTKQALEDAISVVESVNPRFMRPNTKRRYRDDMIAWCRQTSRLT